MHYEINVAKKDDKPGWDGKPHYSHFFATSERSIFGLAELRRVLGVFLEKFPEPEYNLTVTLWEDIGRQQNLDKLKAWIAKPGSPLDD
jgi:hypothetical protein